MQYTLRDLLIVFVLFASALGAFGEWGIAVAMVLLGLVIAVANEFKWIFFALSLGAILGFLSFLGLCGNRIGIQRIACSNKLKNIALGLISYQQIHHKLPPANSVDALKGTNESWRVANLPYAGYSGMFTHFAHDKQNREQYDQWLDQLTKSSMPEYECPCFEHESKEGFTNYVAVIGPLTLWPEKEAGSLEDIPDGAENTILLIELAKSDIHWAEPRDLAFERICQEIASDPELKIFAAHERNHDFFFFPEKGANVAFADGRVEFLPTEFLRRYLKSMLTRNGGEKIHFFDLPEPRLHWPHIVSLILMMASSIALLKPMRRKRPIPLYLSNTLSQENAK